MVILMKVNQIWLGMKSGIEMCRITIILSIHSENIAVRNVFKVLKMHTEKNN